MVLSRRLRARGWRGCEPLNEVIIFKGARILNLRLGFTSRQSLDIDSSLDINCALKREPDAKIQEYIRKETELALKKFFGKQAPVRYVLTNLKVEKNPRTGERPFNWSGFKISINIKDNTKPDVKGLPKMEIDIGSSEELSGNAVSELILPGGYAVRAYTLERIACEKLRAFLSSLPTYIRKIGKRLDTVRVKDI